MTFDVNLIVAYLDHSQGVTTDVKLIKHIIVRVSNNMKRGGGVH